MRTTGEILEAIKSGEMPTHEECYWALQAVELGWTMTASKYREQVFAPKPEALAKQLCENDFQSGKKCMAADPQVWCGPSRDWRNPENQKRRKISVKLFEKALDCKLPNQQRK